ncbi:MAG: hypothetical protein WC748_04880 [Legionellales bacterium]|jgi:hypothetical protein
MPPTNQTISPTKAHPYVDGDILLISNYKPDKKDYFPHASNEELTRSILASMQEKARENNNNTQANVTVFAPMPGRMYFLNRTLTIGNNGPIVKTSDSLKKLDSKANSSTSMQLVHLDNECDLDAYDEIKRWINSQNRYILAAADQFRESHPGWDVHLLIPHIERGAGNGTAKVAELTEFDLFEENHPQTNKNNGSQPSITINFLHQWPDLYSPQDKIKELVNFVAHFNKGQSFFNQNLGEHKIVALTNKEESISAHNIDLQKLPSLEEEDLKLLCDILKISYENYNDGQNIQPGLKTTLQNREAETIDKVSAVNVFLKTCVLSFNAFAGSKNGQTAQGKSIKDPEQNKQLKQIVNQSFWGNILFMAAELPLLILGSGKPGVAAKKIGYNQDPRNENLQLISEISTDMGRGVVNFYQPVVEPIGKSNTSNSSPSSSPPSDDGILNKRESVSSEKTAKLVKGFTGHVSDAIGQICLPEGFYNVHLAMDMLYHILGWYTSILDAVVAEDANSVTQEKYQALDEEFWTHIQSITNKISTQLSVAEPKETIEKGRTDAIYNTACSYLKTNKSTEDSKFSVKSTFSSSDTLNLWYNHVEKIQVFKPDNKPATLAAQPEEDQKQIYGHSIDQSHLAFNSLSVNSDTEASGTTKGYVLLEHLRRATKKLEKTIVGSGSPYAAGNATKPYFKQ